MQLTIKIQIMGEGGCRYMSLSEEVTKSNYRVRGIQNVFTPPPLCELLNGIALMGSGGYKPTQYIFTNTTSHAKIEAKKKKIMKHKYL